MVHVMSAAKRLGQRSTWSLSNLELQKMVYLAHMFYMGQTDNGPLVDGQFEAWAFGPVHPVLYHALKRFGADKVPASAFDGHSTVPDDHPGAEYLDDAVDELPRSRLVAITHWRDGAWAKNYKPYVRNVPITNQDIILEYREREKIAERKKAAVQ